MRYMDRAAWMFANPRGTPSRSDRLQDIPANMNLQSWTGISWLSIDGNRNRRRNGRNREEWYQIKITKMKVEYTRARRVWKPRAMILIHSPSRWRSAPLITCKLWRLDERRNRLVRLRYESGLYLMRYTIRWLTFEPSKGRRMTTEQNISRIADWCHRGSRSPGTASVYASWHAETPSWQIMTPTQRYKLWGSRPATPIVVHKAVNWCVVRLQTLSSGAERQERFCNAQ